MTKYIRCEMTPSAKGKCRCCVYKQVSAGVVDVTLYEGPSKSMVRQVDNFLVEEYKPTYCRRFRVTKKGGDPVYWVSVEGEGGTCDCPGFESHGHCKHYDSVKAILDSAEFVPYNDSPVQCFYDEQEYEDPAY